MMSHDLKYLNMAEEEYQKSAVLSSHSHRVYLVLSGIAQEQGDRVKAYQYLEKASQLSPLTYRISPVVIHSKNTI